MKLLYVILLVLGIYGVASAKSSNSPTGFALASNHFGLNLYRQLSEENTGGKNIFFSPFSLATALAMVYEGSRGDTAKAMEASLGFTLAGVTNPGGEIRNETVALRGSPSEETYAFRSANALLVASQSAVKESYRNTIQNVYEAELWEADFHRKPREIQKMINSWVLNKTEGKIASLLDQPPSSATQMALLNAVYFQGHWASPFDQSLTQSGPFYGTNNVTTPNVPFMQRNKQWPVAELKDINAKMLAMTYVDGNITFYAILPNDQNGDLGPIRAKLTPSYLEEAEEKIGSFVGSVLMPKFSYKTKYDLKRTLSQLGGLSELFSDKANLSGVSDRGLSISQVRHSATIEVDEKGSTATGATYIEALPPSAIGGSSKTLRFDHPFVFLIKHHPTGQILFLGEINQI